MVSSPATTRNCLKKLWVSSQLASKATDEPRLHQNNCASRFCQKNSYVTVLQLLERAIMIGHNAMGCLVLSAQIVTDWLSNSLLWYVGCIIRTAHWLQRHYRIPFFTIFIDTQHTLYVHKRNACCGHMLSDHCRSDSASRLAYFAVDVHMRGISPAIIGWQKYTRI